MFDRTKWWWRKLRPKVVGKKSLNEALKQIIVVSFIFAVTGGQGMSDLVKPRRSKND